MTRPVLLGIGGAHIDRRGMMTSDYIRGASIPGIMREETGGGVFNALRVAAQFGIAAKLLSVRGGDAAGEAVAAEAKRAGIHDLSSVFLDRTTASYTALLGRDGDVVAALADMEIYEKALPRQIARRKTREAIEAADALLIDANMPEEAIVRLMRLAKGKSVHAMAISPAKAVRLRPALEVLSGIYLNKREARSICGLAKDDQTPAPALAERLAALGVARAVLTDGPSAVCVLEDGKTAMIPPPSPEAVADVTGAGDALAGASLASMMSGTDFSSAVKHGLAAAAATVETQSAVADFTSKHRFNALLAQIQDHAPDK